MRLQTVLLLFLIAPLAAIAESSPDEFDRRVEVQNVLNHLHLVEADSSWEARLHALNEPARLTLEALRLSFDSNAGGLDAADAESLLDAAQALAMDDWRQAAALYPDETSEVSEQLDSYLAWSQAPSDSVEIRVARRALGVLRTIDAATRWTNAKAYRIERLGTWSTVPADAIRHLVTFESGNFLLRLPCRLVEQYGSALLAAFIVEPSSPVAEVIASSFDCAAERFGEASETANLLHQVMSLARTGAADCQTDDGYVYRDTRVSAAQAMLANLDPRAAVALSAREPYWNTLESVGSWSHPELELAWPSAVNALTAVFEQRDGLGPTDARELAWWSLHQALPAPCTPITDPADLLPWQRFGLSPSEIDGQELIELVPTLSREEAHLALRELLRPRWQRYPDSPEQRVELLPGLQPVTVLDTLLGAHPDLLGDATLTTGLVPRIDLLRRYIARGAPVDAPAGEEPPLARALDLFQRDAAAILIGAGVSLDAEYRGRTLLDRLLGLKDGEVPRIGESLWREIALAHPDALSSSASARLKVTRALEMLPDAPVEAAALLERVSDPRAEITLALILHVFGDGSDATRERIVQLLWTLYEAFNVTNDSQAMYLWIAYDGSGKSLGYAISALTNAAGADDRLAIDCLFIEHDPDLLFAMEPRTGGSGDGLMARARCGESYRLPPSVQGFFDLLDETRYSPFSGSGTINATIGAIRAMRMTALAAAPKALPPSESWQIAARPCEAWSTIGLWNHDAAKRLWSGYDRAREDLVAHYVARFGMVPEMAESRAVTALWSIMQAADPLSDASRASLRFLILEDAPTESIAALVNEIGIVDEELHTPVGGYFGNGPSTRPEPLTLTAVRRPDVLRLLIDHGLDASAANWFGKTALMAAAQDGDLASARLLLDFAAVDPNAATSSGPAEHKTLDHDHRTALHYAAASGSLEMIRLLLDAGADPLVPDSKGLRPIHYLLGEGPVPPNLKLSDNERLEAIALLR